MNPVGEQKGWGETLPPAALAATGLGAYANALGVRPDALALQWGEPWERAWFNLAGKFDGLTSGLEGRTGRDAAAIVFGVWHHAFQGTGGPPLVGWEQMPPEQQIAWEAATRHLAMVIESEDALDLAREEQTWRVWAERKLGRLQHAGAR